jgi:hypothetical protein
MVLVSVNALLLKWARLEGIHMARQAAAGTAQLWRAARTATLKPTDLGGQHDYSS